MWWVSNLFSLLMFSLDLNLFISIFHSLFALFSLLIFTFIHFGDSDRSHVSRSRGRECRA
jgi:hypothetical protein